MYDSFPPEDDLNLVAQWLMEANRIVAFTGAGISTASGIPDFRGPNGLWARNPLAERTSTLSYYLNDPEVRKVAWEGREKTFDGSAKPNDGHYALVAIQQAGKLSAVVTQNVDGLHQDSGIHEHNVLEVHGTIKYGRCWGCNDRRPMGEFIARVRAGDPDPHCELCGGIVKSDAVLFEQALPQDVLQRSFSEAVECDVLLAIGTTLGVIPAAYVVDRARDAGKKVVIVNGGPTERDHFANLILQGDITRILTDLVARAGFPDLVGRVLFMATFRDLLAAAKAEITEIDTADAQQRIQAGGVLVLDVREPDEYEQGALPNVLHIPRGHLEAQIEGRATDRDQEIVVYCAGGVRSAFAARTLQELGYTNVLSMAGGFGKWKDEGREWRQPVTLTPDQRNRYQRHLLLPEVGVEGQAKLLGAKVLMLGAGGLGSPAALYLAAAGVGTIGIVDMDDVDASNLQRQILHNMDRIGERKVESARMTIAKLNPDVKVKTYDTRLDASNIMDIMSGYDVVVDGADNFPSRYLLNDASVKLGIPVVHGSIFRFEGMVSVFHPKLGPTYRDMVPEPPPAELAPSCAEAGVLGVLPGIIGSIQALETIKIILELGDPLIGRILSVDTTEMSFRVFKLRPDPKNQVTYENRDRIEVRDLDGLCAPWMSH